MLIHVPWEICYKEIQINSKLNFESHMEALFSKTFQNLVVLQRLSNLLDKQKKIFFSEP